MKWLADLNKGIGEAWPMGANSIEHPGSPNIRFPLWTGTFWTMLSDAIEEQNEWRRAVEWVNALTQGRETHEVQMVFSRIPCNGSVWVLTTETERAGTIVSFFAQILSDGFLAERHIDAIVTYLNIQVRRHQPSILKELPLYGAVSSPYTVARPVSGPRCSSAGSKKR